MNGNVAIMTSDLDRSKFNVIGPDMVAELTPYHKRIATQVVLSANPTDGDVYALKGDTSKLAPTKLALLKLADAAGVRWSYQKSKPAAPSICQFCRMAGDNCKTCEHHGTIAYQAVGAYQDAAGQWRELIGTAEVDPSERDQVGRNDGRTEGDRMKAYLLRHVEARAFNAAIRTLGVKQYYTPQELKKPFVVVRTYFDGYSDPDFKRMLMARAAYSASLLYGEPDPHPALSAQANEVLRLVEGQPFAEGTVVDQVTGEIRQPEAPNIANANGEIIRNPAYKEANGTPQDPAPAQTGTESQPISDNGQITMPFNINEVPIEADERPRILQAKSREEVFAAAAKWLPRYRGKTDPTTANEFAIVNSLHRAGIPSLSDARAWPHLCMRNDAEGGKPS